MILKWSVQGGSAVAKTKVRALSRPLGIGRPQMTSSPYPSSLRIATRSSRDRESQLPAYLAASHVATHGLRCWSRLSASTSSTPSSATSRSCRISWYRTPSDTWFRCCARSSCPSSPTYTMISSKASRGRRRSSSTVPHACRYLSPPSKPGLAATHRAHPSLIPLISLPPVNRFAHRARHPTLSTSCSPAPSAPHAKGI